MLPQNEIPQSSIELLSCHALAIYNLISFNADKSQAKVHLGLKVTNHRYLHKAKEISVIN